MRNKNPISSKVKFPFLLKTLSLDFIVGNLEETMDQREIPEGAKSQGGALEPPLRSQGVPWNPLSDPPQLFFFTNCTYHIIITSSELQPCIIREKNEAKNKVEKPRDQ